MLRFFFWGGGGVEVEIEKVRKRKRKNSTLLPFCDASRLKAGTLQSRACITPPVWRKSDTENQSKRALFGCAKRDDNCIHLIPPPNELTSPSFWIASTVLVVELPPPAPPPGPPPLDPCPKIRLNISEVAERTKRRRRLFFSCLASSSQPGAGRARPEERFRRNECLFERVVLKGVSAQKKKSACRFDRRDADKATSSRQPWWRERENRELGKASSEGGRRDVDPQRRRKKRQRRWRLRVFGERGEGSVCVHTLTLSLEVGAAPSGGRSSLSSRRER